MYRQNQWHRPPHTSSLRFPILSRHPVICTKVVCQRNDTCNIDQHSYRATLARDMGATARMIPATSDYIYPDCTGPLETLYHALTLLVT